jgi:hypothetical protein
VVYCDFVIVTVERVGLLEGYGNDMGGRTACQTTLLLFKKKEPSGVSSITLYHITTYQQNKGDEKKIAPFNNFFKGKG